MKTAIFSIHGFDQPFLEKANTGKHDFTFYQEQLSKQTAHLAKGFDAVALFTSDTADAEVLKILKTCGVKFIALRSVGYDHVDLATAAKLKMKVANVPAYSPHAIAEHAVAMMLALNRKLIAAYNRVKRYDFHLDGLTGFDMKGKTVGIIGTGKIGAVLAKILNGFGCNLLGYDIREDKTLIANYGLRYTNLETLCKESDIISLHLPLNTETKYLINEQKISWMKNGVMLINTARGAIVHTESVINGIRSGKIGSYGMDVYEHEKGIFFYDRSQEVMKDRTLLLLSTFSNVLITGHQAFLTKEALVEIAAATIRNLDAWENTGKCENDLF
jgi:D-lactate dehydrogenase